MAPSKKKEQSEDLKILDMSPFIPTVADKVGCKVGDPVIKYTRDLLNDLALELGRQSIIALECERKVTLGSRSIMYAVKSLYPEEMATQAIGELTKSVCTFTADDKGKNTGLIIKHTKVDKFIRDVVPDYRTGVMIAKGAPVAFTAIIEYTMTKLLKAGMCDEDVMSVDDLKLGIKNNSELLKLFHYVSGPDKL